MANEDPESNNSSLEILGYNQPRDSHVHGGSQVRARLYMNVGDDDGAVEVVQRQQLLARWKEAMLVTWCGLWAARHLT